MVKVKLFTSPLKEKKYRAVFYRDQEGKEVEFRHTDFGQKSASDFTVHKDPKRKGLYLKRHRARENWNDPYSAGSLAKHVLWSLPNLRDAWNAYKRKFGFT